MKSAVSYIIIATIAFASTSSAQTSTTCDQDELIAAVAPLLTNTNLATCNSDSGIDFTSSTLPTTDNLDAACSSTACLDLVADVQALDLPDCEVTNGETSFNIKETIDSISNVCGTSTTTTTTTEEEEEGSSSSGTSDGSDTTTTTDFESSSASSSSTTVTAVAATALIGAALCFV